MNGTAMQIQFSQLQQADFSGRIVDEGWFPRDEIELLDGPHGSLTVRLVGSEQALVKGEMTWSVSIPCDRCCVPVEMDLTAVFTYVCIVGTEEFDEVRHETECREEDVNSIYLKEPVIDSGVLCREQAFLALPSRVLCDESCRGLCPNCGIDLNKKQCDCATETNASPFSILSKLTER